ncbi:hypothetical protein JW960_03245 [candidate division KSB1 bacterium]|nr:hypothetical protein [candidate division KSB1 bacterium]
MNSMLDILAGMLIGGMIMILTLTVTERGNREFFNYNADAIVQSNLAQIAHITEWDLRKMGYGIKEAQTPTILQVAEDDQLKYLTHLNASTDQVADTIEYTIIPDEVIDYGDTSLTMYNIYRKITIAGETPDVNMIGKIGNGNVFRYLDQIGNPAPVQMATRMVEVTLVAFNPRVVLSPDFVAARLDSVNGAKQRKEELTRLLRPSFWRQTRLVSKNLRR